jgi:predicted DNA-binding transcriptional regulator YafY
MAYSRIYSRQNKIVEFIRSRKRPTVSDMVDFLAESDEVVSKRTVERDIQNIIHDLGIEIERCGTHPNYFYKIEEGQDSAAIVGSYLEHALLADVMRSEMEAKKKFGSTLFPDRPQMTDGLNNIPLLTPSIQNRKQVRIGYRKFNGEESERVVCPLFLRQFRKRWYLIARDTKDGIAKTFGLERITSVKPLEKKFRPKQGEDYESLFANVIGLFESDAAPVTIRFCSEDYNANYVRSVPLHRSQRELEPADGGAVFELTVVPNYEFYQAMLMMGNKVRILSPQNVREEMKATIKTMLGHYE